MDVEPWDNPSQTPPAVPADGPMDLRSYQESRNTSSKWIKIASLLDQSDESELVPAAPDKVQEWSQRYITTMGAPPEEEEEEEATGSQLAALCKRTVILKQAPYTDFSVWTPFGRRALRSQKFRTFVPLGGCSFLTAELPGPQNLQQWLASWRVFKVVAIWGYSSP